MFQKDFLGKKIRISVLGDSISTYEGYQPYGYEVYYRDEALFESGLDGVRDVWWAQVIDALGGELCVNGSYSGSTVTGNFFPSACSDERCSALHTEETPDLILLYIGTNDRGLNVPIGSGETPDRLCFYGAYRLTLQKLKRNYPAAKIVCATLPLGCREGEERFGRAPSERALAYDRAIREAALKEDCLLADIASFSERYPALDGCHPTKEGHKVLAELWLRALRSL